MMNRHMTIAAIVLAFIFVVGKANATLPTENDLAITNCVMSEFPPSKECFDKVWNKFEKLAEFVDSDNHSMIQTWCHIHYHEFTLIELPQFIGVDNERDELIYKAIEHSQGLCKEFGGILF